MIKHRFKPPLTKTEAIQIRDSLHIYKKALTQNQKKNDKKIYKKLYRSLKVLISKAIIKFRNRLARADLLTKDYRSSKRVIKDIR